MHINITLSTKPDEHPIIQYLIIQIQLAIIISTDANADVCTGTNPTMHVCYYNYILLSAAYSYMLSQLSG